MHSKSEQTENLLGEKESAKHKGEWLLDHYTSSSILKKIESVISGELSRHMDTFILKAETASIYDEEAKVGIVPDQLMKHYPQAKYMIYIAVIEDPLFPYGEFRKWLAGALKKLPHMRGGIELCFVTEKKYKKLREYREFHVYVRQAREQVTDQRKKVYLPFAKGELCV